MNLPDPTHSPPRAAWHIITGEYPPQTGGVADYTAQVAQSLADLGREVHVWAPPAVPSAPLDGHVAVHRLPGRFDPRSLRQLREGLARSRGPRRILLQYVVGSFGYHAMNLPFAISMALHRSDPLWIMFHEYAYPLGWRLKPQHNLLGLVTPFMAGLLARRADRILVSTPSWIARLPSGVRKKKAERISWLPIPSNIPVRHDDELTRGIRKRLLGPEHHMVIGHFGTYGPLIAPLLRDILLLVAPAPGRRILLMGRGSVEFKDRMARESPALEGRLSATGPLGGSDMAAHLKACDVLVQPYDDGVTSRRGTLMAGLALGVPIVTNSGRSAESLFADEGAIAMTESSEPRGFARLVEDVLASPERRATLSRRAASLYEERFSVQSTVRTLCDLAARDEGDS